MFWQLDHAVDGITWPMDYKHMIYLRWVLRFVSGWPAKMIGEKVTFMDGLLYSIYMPLLSIIYFTMGLLYLEKHVRELTFLELGHNYIVLLMTILSTSRGMALTLAVKYKLVTKLFVREFHLFYHKDKSEFSMEIHFKVHRISHYFSIYLTCIMWIALILFNMTPVYNNFVKGKYHSTKDLVNTTYEHSLYFVYPFNSDSNFRGYMIATAFNWYGTYLSASTAIMFDLFLSIMVFHLWGHFKILIHLLETFPLPETLKTQSHDSDRIPGAVLYSESEQLIIAEKLKDCINYHLIIVNFTKSLSEGFGLMLFAYLTFHQISGCLLLLEVSQLTPDALARYLPFTVLMFGELIQLSVIFEIVGTMSEKLRDAVYLIPWEYMNTKNRKTAYFFYTNVQEPMHINAGGLVTVGVQTMASIFKTSFTYFTFLRTVQSNQ